MNYKQIILIRKDVDMRCGKMCVQVAHASIKGVDLGNKETVDQWKFEGMRKIVLKVPDLVTMLEVAHKAEKHLIQYAIITDFGLTQVDPNTITCVGFPPLKEDSEKGLLLSELTKNLSLL